MLDTCEITELNEREIFWINWYGTFIF